MSYPWPRHEWNEIFPRLYQGGHVYEIEGCTFSTKLKGVQDFDFVFSLYDESSFDPDTAPDPDVEHVVWEILDSTTPGLPGVNQEELREHVKVICARLAEGKRVLIRCHAGYNRSGLVCALVLVRQGIDPATAISMLREKRSPWALRNRAFEKYVREHGLSFREEPVG